VKLINGSIDKPYINVKNSNEITSAQAEKNAFKAIGKSKSKVKNIKGYDIVSKNNLDINSDKQKLVYNIELNYVSPKVAHWKIQVDAATGKIIKKQNTLQKATTEGKGTGVNGDVKSPLNLTQSQNQYTLHDTSSNATIDTQTANNTTNTMAPITNDST
ncbi:PepSY domain-containing protein, partial [Staphylococcus aureus]